MHVLAGSLHREVDDRRRAAKRRRDGAGFEGVRCRRATKGQLHVRVNINAAGQHVLSTGVQHTVAGRLYVVEEFGRSECGDLFAINQQVITLRAGRGDDVTAGDEDSCHVVTNR